MSDEPEDSGCGISWLWQVTNDPLKPACDWHDTIYEHRLDGVTTPPLAVVDAEFLRMMLNLAGDSWRLRARAYFYWALARVWGLTVRRKLWKS